LRSAEVAASSMGIEVKAAPVHDVAEIERAIVAVAGDANGGLINLPDVFLVAHRELTIELTARHRGADDLSISLFCIEWWPDVLRG